MDINLNELVVLSLFSASNPEQAPADVAYGAVRLCPQPSFDAAVALQTVKHLVVRRLLRETKEKKVALTWEGHSACLQALPVLEQLRANIAGVSYRIGVR
jgi:hypothetical protein